MMSVQYTTYPDFPSEYVKPRRVDVWLPEDYHEHPDKHYAVLYMHDGQNIFDPKLAYTGIDWGVVPAYQKLRKSGEILKDVIIVGVWNTEYRLEEYLPYKPFLTRRGAAARERISRTLKSEPLSNHYLKFLVDELKPFIDHTYSTYSDQQNTFIMGSSMGGLISLYAICEYPHIFCGAGCLSTHWPIIKTLMRDYLKGKLPNPDTHKIYFDYGTEGLDAHYEPHQKRVDRVMENGGYHQENNWITRKFDGADHNEAAWRERIHIPLKFLLSVDG